MNPIHLVNAMALGLALVLGALAVARSAPAPASPTAPVATTVADVRGVAVPVGNYARIVSLSLVADSVLAALAQPGTVAAISAYSTGEVARRWTGKPRLPGLDDLEAIIALHPDLVLVSTYGGETDRMARLQAAGLRVFALGAMEGLTSFQRDARVIGGVLGQAAAGERLGATLAGRLARVAALLPPGTHRPTALYLSSFGDALFGGTVDTSYHDVLTAAGCTDAAAAKFRGWPQLSVEQVLVLAPEILVVRRGQAAVLARRPGLERLTGRWVELDGDLLEDAGTGMLDAAEALYAAVHGPLPLSGPAEPSRP